MTWFSVIPDYHFGWRHPGYRQARGLINSYIHSFSYNCYGNHQGPWSLIVIDCLLIPYWAGISRYRSIYSFLSPQIIGPTPMMSWWWYTPFLSLPCTLYRLWWYGPMPRYSRWARHYFTCSWFIQFVVMITCSALNSPCFTWHPYEKQTFKAEKVIVFSDMTFNL